MWAAIWACQTQLSRQGGVQPGFVWRARRLVASWRPPGPSQRAIHLHPPSASTPSAPRPLGWPWSRLAASLANSRHPDLGRTMAEEEVVNPQIEVEESCKPQCVKALLAYQVRLGSRWPSRLHPSSDRSRLGPAGAGVRPCSARGGQRRAAAAAGRQRASHARACAGASTACDVCEAPCRSGSARAGTPLLSVRLALHTGRLAGTPLASPPPTLRPHLL